MARRIKKVKKSKSRKSTLKTIKMLKNNAEVIRYFENQNGQNS
jgi:hypothetical protein